MRSVDRLISLVVGFSLFAAVALAEEIPAPPIKLNPTPSAAAPTPKLVDFFSAKTPYEFWLTCIILVAGLLFAYLAVSFLRQIHRQELESATRAMTILFVIIATMVLITAGYNNEQIAPAFGLFGTIVGYILGKGSEKRGEQEAESAAVNDKKRAPAAPPRPAPTPKPASISTAAAAPAPPKPQSVRTTKPEE